MRETMVPGKLLYLLRVIALLCVALSLLSPRVEAQQTKRPFTVPAEIELTLLGTLDGGTPEVHFSPDGNYCAVWSERGQLDLNRVEDSLRFYGRKDVEAFLKHPETSQPVTPVWIVNRSDKEGSVINDWRWLPDSSGVAFVEGGGDYGNKRLILADLRKKVVEPLTPTTEVVQTFDVRAREHYVYTAFNGAERETPQPKTQPTTTIGTGHSLPELLFPDEYRGWRAPPSHLWAVTGGK